MYSSEIPETKVYLQNGAVFETEAIYEQTCDVREIHTQKSIDMMEFRRSAAH